MLGFPDQAVRRGREGLELALELSHPASMAIARMNLSMVHQIRGEAADTEEQSEACQRLVEEHGIPFFPGVALGWAMARRGQPEEGVARIRAGMPADATKAPRFWVVYFGILLTEACTLAGRLDEARTALAEAEGLVAASSNRLLRP